MGSLKRIVCERRHKFLVLTLTSLLMTLLLTWLIQNDDSIQRDDSFVCWPASKQSVPTRDSNITLQLKPSEGIPKIIHQIWTDDVIPQVFQENIKGLVKHNKPPVWQYYLWTFETGAQFIKKFFPDLVHRYSTARDILKADNYALLSSIITEESILILTLSVLSHWTLTLRRTTAHLHRIHRNTSCIISLIKNAQVR